MEALIKRVPSLQLTGTFTNALDARQYLQNNTIDILFVDVEMPDLSGLDFIRTLTEKPEIVIASSKEKYAIDAYEIDVADYLLKPVALDRFLKAINRIEARLHVDSESKITQDSIFVKANNQLINIRLSDILYIEAYGDYVTIFTDKDRYIVHGTMKGIESKLPDEQFMRVHRSHIIRLDKINAIEDTLIQIGKKLIPIGDSYRSDLMKRLSFL